MSEQEQPQPKDTPPAFAAPDHPDYEHLLSVLSEGIEKAAREGDKFDMEAYVAQYVDTKSLAAVALGRVMAALHITSPFALHEQMDAVMRTSAVYLEAFSLGVEFERDRQRMEGLE